ncbi:unnamed protein product [Peniophora sp. CBMAI 1063]|nr:unnamed protein product [Peniophora sp. CBMAI 1063]
MSRRYPGVFRQALEGTLTRHFDNLAQRARQTRAAGGVPMIASAAAFDDHVFLTQELLPLYVRGINRMRTSFLLLPPELLRMILDAAIWEDRKNLRKWFRYGHVCRDLRLVLLGMHELWAPVVFDWGNARASQEFLRRAWPVPIKVSMSRMESEEQFRLALGVLLRARSITLDEDTAIPEETALTAVVNILRQRPLPLLEKLNLGIIHSHETELDSPLLSADFPNLIAPRLRKLSLNNVFIPVDMSLLTHLRLYWSRPPIPAVDDADVFFDMLSRCGNLEELTLQTWLPFYEDLREIQAEDRRLTFPRLRYLNLRHDLQTILEFWNIISIPASAALDLDAAYGSEGDDGPDTLLEHTRLLSAFIANTQTGGASKISKIAVYRPGDLELEVHLGATEDGQPATPELASRPRHSSELSWDPRGEESPPSTFKFLIDKEMELPADLVEFLRCLCDTLKLRADSIDTLCLGLGEGYFSLAPDGDALHTMFPAVAELHPEHIDGADIKRLLDASSERGCHYYPNLQALHFSCSVPSEKYDTFVDVVERRAKYGGGTLRFVSVNGIKDIDEEYELDKEAPHLDRFKDIEPHVQFDVYKRK